MRGKFKNSGRKKRSRKDILCCRSSISEVTINNIVQYNGTEPLILEEDDGTIIVSGDGKINVVDNLTFWNSGFEIVFEEGNIHTLVEEKLEGYNKPVEINEVLIEYTGIGRLLQNIGGFTMDLKYGVLTESWDGDDREGYAINFGGNWHLLS